MNGMTHRTLDRYTRALGTAIGLAVRSTGARVDPRARACHRREARDVAELARRIGAADA